MNIVDALQGTNEWLAARAGCFTASEAPAMMGASKYQERSALLKQKATGLVPEVGDHTQRLFDRGHAAEEAARPIVEGFIGESLYPVTGWIEVDGLRLLASFDGLTAMDDIAWETKLWNAMLADAVRAGELSPHYYWQLEQQLLVSGAERAYFTTSDGTPENTVGMWYESVPARRAQLIAGWKQFAADLAEYQHVETVAPVVAAPIKDLPAIVITATGSLSVETNFDKWEIELRDFIKRIPEKPSTDQEFADCKAAVAAFKKAEAALDAEEARVLTMVPSVDDMRRQKKLLRDLSSTTRLALEKLVVKRDIDVKYEIVTEASAKFDDHIKTLNARLGGQFMPHISPSFSEAMKSKRSYATMRDAVDAALSSAKADASMTADRIELNRNSLLIGTENDTSHLFPDFAAVCTKAREDFAALHAMRIQQEAVRKEDARKAEEARIAAAVEAERKAGEARAAAAVEAERQAEAKRGQLTQENDQRGKTEDANHAQPQVIDAAQPTAAITPPTAEEKRAILVDAGDDVRAYLNTLDVSEKEFGRLRAVLMGYEQFKSARALKAAA